MLLRLSGRPPVYYFPRDDVAMQALTESSEENEGWRLWHVADDEHAKAWEMLDSMTTHPKLVGYVTFAWSAMDTWFEEDEEVYVHPRDPRVRLDILPSSKHIKIEILGEIIAETCKPILLFETGIRTRYYIPKTDVRLDLLEPSEHVTHCPYKGEAHYFSVNVDTRRCENIAWYYRFPTLESSRIASTIAFYDERVDAMHIDGEQIKLT